MAPPIEHRCPACGTLAATTRAVLVPIGRPFFECASCKGFVERAPFREWSGMPGSGRLRVFSRGALIALSVAVSTTLAAWLIGGRTMGRETLLAVGLILVVLGLSSWALLLSSAIASSNRRMGDPMYRARLAEFEMNRLR